MGDGAILVAKIACLTPKYFSDESYIGGGERYPLNLSRGIVESSGGAYSVDLISFGPKSRSYPLGPGLTVKVLAAARPPINPLDVVSWELPAAIAEADLIHVHQAYTRCSEMAYLVAKQQGKPIVVTDHGGTTSTLGTSIGSLELADHIVSNSKFGASLYRTSTPITVIKGGVDGIHFTPPRRRGPRDRVLYVGRLLPHKGIDQLITALPAELPLTVCGRPYDPQYFALLQGLAVGKDVTFVTDADDDAILELYRRAWANVLPSVYRDYYGHTHLCPELMGFTLLEAMACGTPAICSNVAGDARVRPRRRDRLRVRRPAHAHRPPPEPGRRPGPGRAPGPPGPPPGRAGVRFPGRRRPDDLRLRTVDRPGAGGGRVKVLVLSNLYPPDVIGGYELGCKQVVDALRLRGHDVRVLTIAPRTPVPHEPHVLRALKLSEVWNSNRYVLGVNHQVTNRLMDAESTLVSAFNVHALARALDEFRPDVAYVWMIVGVGGLGLMAALQHLKVPWLWHLMDDVPVALCRPNGRVVGPLLREVDRQLDGRYLACSRQLVDEVEAAGVRLRPDVEVVPNWVVGEAPEPRTAYYRTGQPLRIIAAGQIAHHKGVDILIEAAAEVRLRGFENIQVDIYGNVEDNFFPTLVRRLGLDGHVSFKGSRPQAELARLYPLYHLFAFPTWQREPFAFAPLEASWRGCVPLMSQLSGNAEWAVHGVHCLKADRSSVAFADSLCSILDGSVDLEPIARRAAAVIGRDFHLDAQVPRIERALAEAARKPRGGAGTAADAYRMALLAEKLTKVLVQEAMAHA